MSITVSPDDIIAEAETFLGVRWRHQGRSKAQGVDCVGLPLMVWVGLGLGLESDVPAANYPRLPDGTFLEMFRSTDLIEVNRTEAQIGDIGVFAMLGRPCHCGIITTMYDEPAIIHAHAAYRKVVKENLKSVEFSMGRMTNVFRFPGVK